MDHPDQPDSSSHARAGEIEDKPDSIIAVVVTDQHGDPAGVLEKWSGDAWIYCDADDVQLLEPEPGPDGHY